MFVGPPSWPLPFLIDRYTIILALCEKACFRFKNAHCLEIIIKCIVGFLKGHFISVFYQIYCVIVCTRILFSASTVQEKMY